MEEKVSRLQLEEEVERDSVGVFLSLVLGITLLSFGPLMVRLAGVEASASAFWRLGLAAPLLFLIVRQSGDSISKLGRPLIAEIAIAGCLYGFGTLAMNASAMQTTLANCALIGNFSSFFVAGIALVAERNRLGPSIVFALVFSAVGLLLLLGPSVAMSRATAAGDILALLAALLFTGYFILLMRMPPITRPMSVHAVSTTAGAIVVAPSALAGDLTPLHWWPILTLVAAQVGGQGLVVYAMPRVAPVLGGLCILLFPLINMVIGWSLYDEGLGGPQLVGAILILSALAMLQLRKRDLP